jgi:hypothetical protein
MCKHTPSFGVVSDFITDFESFHQTKYYETLISTVIYHMPFSSGRRGYDDASRDAN